MTCWSIYAPGGTSVGENFTYLSSQSSVGMYLWSGWLGSHLRTHDHEKSKMAPLFYGKKDIVSYFY